MATLLSCIGSDVLDIFDGLSFDTEADRQDITKVLEKLEEYCIGETNKTYERYVFNKREQQQGESFDFGTLQDNLLTTYTFFSYWNLFRNIIIVLLIRNK